MFLTFIIAAAGLSLSIYGKKSQLDSNVIHVYKLRVTVVDHQEMPIEDAKVWSSSGGEPKKVAGGQQFDIPSVSLPRDGQVSIYATMENAFLRGDSTLQLGEDPNPTLTIHLKKPLTVVVRGIVIDESQRGIAGVRIYIVGYERDAFTTLAVGNFELPAHAAEGEQVLLHFEKEGFAAENRWISAGSKPITLILERE